MAIKGQMSQNSTIKISEFMIEKEAAAFQKLIQYFSDKLNLSEADVALIYQYGSYKHLTKKTLLHKSGMIAVETFFVVKGLFRLFTTNDDGEEFNLQFSAENYWINDYESYISGNPSGNFLEALEDSEVISFRKEDLNLVLEQSATLRLLVEQLITKNTLVNKDRLMHQLIDSPQKLYEDFVRQYPHISNRIPLYMMASYLGISRKTLTRIRGGR